jgi:Na+/H+ antiporter NhaD/arsenite permease-like protein
VHLSAAKEQAWHPFVLVTGLLLIGLVANRDGLFEQAGRFLEGLRGPPSVLLAACLLLVAVVTAILNLDTAAVLLSARSVAHPSALLLGLNVGPNIAASGSLSAFLWWRAARQVRAQPSLLAFSRRDIPLGVVAMVLALGAASILRAPEKASRTGTGAQGRRFGDRFQRTVDFRASRLS